MREEEVVVHILIKTKTEEEERKKDNTEMRADTENIVMTETDTEIVMAGGTVIMIKEDINTKFCRTILNHRIIGDAFNFVYICDYFS